MNYQVGIIGGGPVGLAMAANLSLAGHQVTLCEISPQIREIIKVKGIQVEGVHTLHSNVYRVIEKIEDFDFSENSPVNMIFIAAKATAIKSICSSLKKVRSEKTSIISWQNGIDTEKAIAEQLGEKNLYRAVVNYGVACKEIGRVVMSFEHPPHWIKEIHSDWKEQAKVIADMLSKSGVTTKRCEELENAVWSKTILNSSTAAICALNGMTLREVMVDPHSSQLVDKLLKECIQVARANEITLGKNFYFWAKNYMLNGGAHRPSILLDIEAGNKTEIDFINGKIQEYGKYVGIETPYNESMLLMIKAKETMVSK